MQIRVEVMSDPRCMRYAYRYVEEGSLLDGVDADRYVDGNGLHEIEECITQGTLRGVLHVRRQAIGTIIQSNVFFWMLAMEVVRDDRS